MLTSSSYINNSARRNTSEGVMQLANLPKLSLLAAVLLLAPQAVAQEPSATQAREPRVQTTIKTTVRQVLLDVVVTDGKNHPVTGLQREDFSVLEDGESQRILFFEAHSGLLGGTNPKPPALPPLPPNTFANVSVESNNSPLNVLLYDLVNTPIDDQPFAHKEVVKFLRSRPAGSRFAIFVLGDTLHLLQGFTDDERQLEAAMNRKEADPHSSASYQASEDPHDTSERLSGSPLFANELAAQATLGRLQHMEAFTRNFFLQRRVDQTIAAFTEIARFLRGLPGRKNLLWLSGAFPANIFPDNDPLDPFGAAGNYSSELRQAADLLTVGQVAVYPVDIRGLTTDTVFDAANSQTYRTPADLRQAHMHFMLQIAAEQAVMDQIADDTGGHAFYNTNGLSGAIATCTEDGANYYTLTYAPSNTKFDGRLRKIRVQLSHGSYHLAYRHSYLSDNSVVEEKAANTPITRLQVALRRGVPLTQEISLQAHITAQGRPKTATKEEIAQLAPFPAFASRKKLDGVKIQRFLIDYAIEGSQVSLEPAEDSALHAKFEILFGAYDAADRTMFGERSPLVKTYSVKNPDEIRKGTFHVQHVLEIPSEAAWLRIAVRDVIGDRLGSVEIPLPLAPEKANAVAR
jgi:VWFA-related protein